MLIEFLWLKGGIPQLNAAERLRIAITAPPVELVPELFFAYYFSHNGLDELADRQKPALFTLVKILAVLAACTVAERLIANYVVIPHIYQNRVPKNPLLEPIRLVTVLLYVMFASAILLSMKSVRAQLAAKEREKNLIKEKLETELKYLKSQINPHFLFNTLNNIYALARKKSDSAPEAVMKLSELLSFMLYESGKETIPLKDEIKIVEDYLCLEKLRYTDRLSVCFKKDVDNDAEPIAPLLLIPLVENAFKHGISESRFASFVHIRLTLQNKTLLCTVENSVENGKRENGNSPIGLNNLRRQLQLLYGEHGIDVRPARDTYAVDIKINLNSYGKV